jgi:uncharacterized phage protein (TIGR01671 family)
MSRIVKYRVWDKYKKQMYPVAEISFGDDGSALTIVIQPAPKSKYYRALVHGENCELLEYTGLNDVAGKEIYEGDVVRFGLDDEKFDRIGAIGYSFAEFTIVSLARKYPDVRLSDTTRLEIIGNIYENPKFPGEVKPHA